MKALISGKAGMAILLQDNPEFRPVGGEPYSGSDEDIAPALAGFDDVEEIDVDTVKTLDRKAGQAWAIDRSRYLMFLLLRGEEGEEADVEIADEILNMLRTHQAYTAFKRSLNRQTDNAVLEKVLKLGFRFPKLVPYFTTLDSNLPKKLELLAQGRMRAVITGAGGTTRTVYVTGTKGSGEKQVVISVRARGAIGRVKSRPKSDEEARAAQILEKLVAGATEKTKRFPKSGFLRHRAVDFDVVAKIYTRVIAALAKEGLSASVKPFTKSEIAAAVSKSQGRRYVLTSQKPKVKTPKAASRASYSAKN